MKTTQLTYALFSVAIAASFSGCGGGSNSNPNIAGISYSGSFVNNTFRLATTFKGIQLPQGGTFPLDPKNMPNSTVEIGPDFQSNGTIVAVNLDITDVANALKVSVANPQTLPGGRPLPGVAAGSLPALAFELKSLDDIWVYLGNGAFGAFVPVKLPINQYIATFRFFADGQRVGNISIVGADAQGKNSGFLVLVSKGIPVVAKTFSNAGLK